jgi:predicted Rossmann-fold nucleotide-binding protein
MDEPRTRSGGELIDLPFVPIRTALYTPEELLEGFDPGNPASLDATKDFSIYRLFVEEKFGANQSPFTSMMESLHDHFINQSVISFLASKGVAVGIMGGHDLARDSDGYRQVAELGRRLAKHNALVVSGGGPGAMEAAHLGAALVQGSDSDLENALVRLSTRPRLPTGLKKIVMSTGRIDGALRDQWHAWWRPAVELHRSFGSDVGSSLALPTWCFGHEAFTPFASHIGKYFQNSLREDGLVTFCTGGVVFTPGGAGTLQEIFQDAAQNYYTSAKHRFNPMVFLGSRFWSSTLGAVPLLKQLLNEKDYASSVLVTDSIEQAVEMLLRRAATASA